MPNNKVKLRKVDLKNKILFIVPDGVGIRNYLYSDIISLAMEKCEVALLTPLKDEAFAEIYNSNEITKYHLSFEVESYATRICRESVTFARLLHNAKIVKNDTILTYWNYNPKGVKQKTLNYIAQKIGTWASKKYNRILSLEKKAINNWSDTVINRCKKQLQEIAPTTIFITHQRVASLMPICIAAQQLGIVVISVIYSWDNLPKARLAVQADKYLVWSSYMKQEMALYYPEIAQDKVKVTGTPQFEFYDQKNKISSRAEFALKYNMDPNKKWICFSGDDIKTSPYDAVYLENVAEAIAKIPEGIRPQIIFRRCPVDFSSRYDVVLEKYKKIIISIDPIWNVPEKLDSWGTFFPKKEDVDLQVNLAFHCELVINLGSTMAHDFAIYNKPCFYLNYNPVESESWSVEMIYNYQHFKSMKGLDAVGWLNSTNEITNKISKVLEGASNVAPDKLKWLQLVNTKSIEGSSQLIVNEIIG